MKVSLTPFFQPSVLKQRARAIHWGAFFICRRNYGMGVSCLSAKRMDSMNKISLRND